MTDLAGALADHAAWAAGRGGKRANLRGANLCGVKLRGVNLYGANLRDDTRIVQASGIGPHRRTVTYDIGADVVMCAAWDFRGTLAEFEARVEAIAVDCPRTAMEYRGTIGFFRSLAQTGPKRANAGVGGVATVRVRGLAD